MNHRPTLTGIALIATLLGASLAANAQEQADPNAPTQPQMQTHPHHRSLMARALDGMTLTPSEHAQIRAAMAKFKASRKTSTPETRRDLQADVEAALTPDQRTQFESNVRTARLRMKAERKADAEATSQPS